jgi:hypothetical protein
MVGVCAGLVLLATQVLSFSSPVAVAISALAAAALFSPLRNRVQQAADRRFNRARCDADRTVAEDEYLWPVLQERARSPNISTRKK